MPKAMTHPQSVRIDSAVYIAHSVSRVIHRYDLQTKEWNELPPYHHWSFTMIEPMNTPRCWPAVSTYHQCLVVVGGRDDSETDVATVEILDMSIPYSQWLSATLLP